MDGNVNYFFCSLDRLFSNRNDLSPAVGHLFQVSNQDFITIAPKRLEF